MTTPRSRQWVAAEDGEWSGGAGTLPEKESCPHCANTKTADGFCGIVDSRDYDNPKDANGDPLQPQAQAVYVEGQIIETEIFFSTNHRGHHVLFGCPDFHNPSKECFQQHPLEFVDDLSMETFGTDANAPKDPNYPERGYVNFSAQRTRMRFKLPQGLTGDLVLLQWHWVTGNSCRSAGYDEYPFPSGWESGNLDACPTYENLSNTGAGQPEQFWNCIEVKIVPGGPPSPTSSQPSMEETSFPSAAPISSTVETSSPSAAPISSTVETSSPSVAPSDIPPVSSGDGCCSQNFRNCDAAWCGDTEDSCNLSCGGEGKIWLPNGALTSCKGKWSACTNDVNGCCAPAVCTGGRYYRQCL